MCSTSEMGCRHMGLNACLNFLAGISDLCMIDCLGFCWECRLSLGSPVSSSPVVAVVQLMIWSNDREKEGCFSLRQERFYFDGHTK